VTIASPQNDPDGFYVSIDQQVGGGCQNGSDPATCFLGNVEDVSKCDQGNVDLSLKMCWDVLPKPGYVTNRLLHL